MYKNNFSKIMKEYSDCRVYGLAVLIIHVLGIALLALGVRRYPELLSMGMISYTLGLQHAFDADHIAAIDNTVRKLVQQKQNPRGVGYLFSLGHSSVVILMAMVTIVAVRWIQQYMPQLQKFGGLTALAISATFLIVIGIVNLKLWVDILQEFKMMRRGKQIGEVPDNAGPKGFIERCSDGIFKLINKNWHVYILGFVFGLSFDTATQISLLAIAAGAASEAVPTAAILAFPLLFTAGMTMMDTLDGIFMTTAYQWVFSSPMKKIYYNLTVTGLSIIAALFIGIVEILQVIGKSFGLENSSLAWVINLDLGMAGYILVALFVVVWGISYLGWKRLGLGKDIAVKEI
ncbi:MAG: nickel permease [Clostridiales bacterium GWB2_37_7]|nr:MAG: nickel permease [Clostridiales bacterium GWB2_37_7]